MKTLEALNRQILEGDIEDVYPHLYKILSEEPYNARANIVLAQALMIENRWEEAEYYLKRSVAIEPEMAGNYSLLAMVQDQNGVPKEVIEATFQQGLRVSCGHCKPLNWNYSLWLLGQGKWKEGFSWYCWRNHAPRTQGIPYLKEPPPPGSHVLVHSEQGLGDAVMFARFLRGLSQKWNCRVSWEVPFKMVNLFEGFDGVDQIYGLSSDGDIRCKPDFIVSMVDLPSLLDYKMEEYENISYLGVPAYQRAVWLTSVRLGAPSIALCWKGNPEFVNDKNRSLPDEMILDVVRSFPEMNFFAANVPRVPLEKSPKNLYDASVGFLDVQNTASFLSAVDLVISVDTLLLHLAGALGRDVIGLHYAPEEWRWRSGYKWYPKHKRLVQSKNRDWTNVIKELKECLSIIQPGLQHQTSTPGLQLQG